MDGLGERLRQRARELGLTDTEVARRLGLSQARYAHYVNDKREPDFRTFVHICRILATTPDHLFGVEAPPEPQGLGEAAGPSAFAPPPSPETQADLLRDRILAAAEAMSLPTLKTTATVMDALVRVRPEQAP